MSILLGIFYHSIGSFAAGSFMAPYKKIRSWSFENYWIIMGLFAWIITPILVASLSIPDLADVLRSSPPNSLIWTFFFGFFWGIGAITFGLAVRFLGYGLGYSLTLGISAVVGTILPPIYEGKLIAVFSGIPGFTLLFAVMVCIAGIIFCIRAGYFKDQEINTSNEDNPNREYDYRKGIVMALICGFFATFTGF